MCSKSGFVKTYTDYNSNVSKYLTMGHLNDIETYVENI